jgi:hypothetical protein
VLVADRDTKLPRLETKPGAEFEQEALHVIQERRFEIILRVSRPGGEPGEFEDIGIANEILDGRGRVGRLFARTRDDGAFVFGEPGALVKLRADLPLKLTHGPRAEQTFVFVESTFPWVVNAEKLDQVRPGELKDASGQGDQGRISAAL